MGYSIKHDELLINQCQQEVQPNDLKGVLKSINIDLKNRLNLSPQRVEILKKRRQQELTEIKSTGLLKKEDLSEGNFSGRKNADENWVLQRGEQGNAQNSSSSKSDKNVISIKKSFQYLCSTDKTICDGKMLGGILQNANFNESIFRKVENDWNMTYLARTEGSEKGGFRLVFSSETMINGLKLE